MDLIRIPTFLFTIIPFSIIAENEFKYSVGAGYGVEFGGAGIKLDYNIFDNAYITTGLGVAPSAGFQYYIRKQGVKWRPKIGIHYGIVGHAQAKNYPVLFDEDNPHKSDEPKNEERFFYGILLEFGQTIHIGDNGRNAIDISLTLPLSDGGEEKWKDNHNQDDGYNNHNLDFGNALYYLMPYLSIGYKFHF